MKKQTQKKPTGRPAIDEAGSVKVSVLIPLDRWHELQAIAAKDGESSASTIRRMICAGLEAKKAI